MIGQGRGASALAPTAPVLIIDPGHGGLDGGAVSAEGQKESEINLDIALKLRDLCRLFGAQTIMTRTSETLDYPEELSGIHEKKVWDQKQRVQCINAVENAVLLSIHQNTYPDPRPIGVQVLYGQAMESQRFAELAHGSLTQALCPESRRVAAPISRKIYLFQQLRCPAILVECGFLSNRAEAEKLADPQYQSQIASVLLASYLQFIS